MTAPVPSLSMAGWVNDPTNKSDLLMSHFFEADKAQTYLYGQNISNLQWIIEQYGSNINDVTQQMRYALETYLSRYYDTVIVDVSSDDNASNLTLKVELKIYCKVTDGGKDYVFGKILTVASSKIQKIISMNNDNPI